MVALVLTGRNVPFRIRNRARWATWGRASLCQGHLQVKLWPKLFVGVPDAPASLSVMIRRPVPRAGGVDVQMSTPDPRL